MINPISGRTRDEEILVGLACGGRLPFDAFDALRRGKPSRKKKSVGNNRREKKKSA